MMVSLRYIIRILICKRSIADIGGLCEKKEPRMLVERTQ